MEQWAAAADSRIMTTPCVSIGFTTKATVRVDCVIVTDVSIADGRNSHS